MNKHSEPLIMLVDDSEIDLFVNKKFLRVAGISDNVISYQSALEALSYINDHSEQPEKLPKIILLDLQMPVVNGFGFLERFEEHTENIKQQCKIIMLSSSVDPTDIGRAHENKRVVNILRKPLDLNEFIDVLNKCA